MYSARKPYLQLKMSIAQLYKSRIAFIKELNQKFSEFEKPYLEGEYPPMHLTYPEDDWGGWTPPHLPGGAFPLSPFPSGKMDCVVHCWHADDCYDWVECLLLAWGGDKGAGSWKISGDVLEWEHVEGITVDVRIKLSGSEENPHPVAYVCFEDEHGGECCTTVSMTCDTCDEGAGINYTTLTMDAGEAQTLTASLPGSLYTWEITSGGGSLSESSGNATIYTAPGTNPECANDATIELKCDEDLLDSITISINAIIGCTGTATSDVAYRIDCCHPDCPENTSSCTIWYRCDGSPALWVDGCCSSAGGCASCNTMGACYGYPTYCCEYQSVGGPCETCPSTVTTDLRTEAMITAGCCLDTPGGL